jgi:hypothetical protein
MEQRQNHLLQTIPPYDVVHQASWLTGLSFAHEITEVLPERVVEIIKIYRSDDCGLEKRSTEDSEEPFMLQNQSQLFPYTLGARRPARF